MTKQQAARKRPDKETDSDPNSLPPNAPLPFWRWGWRNAGLLTRTYYIYRVTFRPLAVIAAIIGAILVVVDVIPRVRSTLFWRDVEYAKLQRVHAGYDFRAFTDVLGVPTQSGSLGTTGFREYVFVRREFYVQIVTDPAQRVAMYNVTSCDRNFQPTFDVGESEHLQLQTKPLARGADPNQRSASEAGSTGTEELLGRSRVDLLYQPGSTGSTPENYQEWSGPASTATQDRSYFVGVNPLCVPLRDQKFFPHVAYQGALEKAPQSAAIFRQHYAANSFTETTSPLMPIVNELGQIVVSRDQFLGVPRGCAEGANPACASVFNGPWGYELPPSTKDRGTTRMFP